MDDADKIASMGAVLHAESIFSNLPYDGGKIADLVSLVISRDDAFHVVAELDGEIIGFMAGRLDEYIFGEGVIARDIIVYVDKKHRGSMAFIKMARLYLDWGDLRADITILSHLNGTNLRAIDSIYRRLGLKHVGGFYMTETNNG